MPGTHSSSQGLALQCWVLGAWDRVQVVMPCAIRYTHSAYLYDAVPCTYSCPRCASCARRTQVPTRTCLPTAACSAACSAQQDPQE